MGNNDHLDERKAQLRGVLAAFRPVSDNLRRSLTANAVSWHPPFATYTYARRPPSLSELAPSAVFVHRYRSEMSVCLSRVVEPLVRRSERACKNKKKTRNQIENETGHFLSVGTGSVDLSP